MEIAGLSGQLNVNVKDAAEKVQAGKLQNSGDDMANQMKDIKKARLQRQVMADPSLAGKLVAAEASPMYNAKGEVIQAVSSNLGNV